MSAIAITVFEDAEKWIRENVPDLAWDNVAAVHPSFGPRGRFEFDNRDAVATFVDDEDGSVRDVPFDDLVKGLRLLCETIGRTLFVGGIKTPHALTDPGAWDVEVVDAYWQLVYRGEVIYG